MFLKEGKQWSERKLAAIESCLCRICQSLCADMPICRHELRLDTVGQTDVDHTYFYIPLSSEYEHEANEKMASFIQYTNKEARSC